MPAGGGVWGLRCWGAEGAGVGVSMYAAVQFFHWRDCCLLFKFSGSVLRLSGVDCNCQREEEREVCTQVLCLLTWHLAVLPVMLTYSCVRVCCLIV